MNIEELALSALQLAVMLTVLFLHDRVRRRHSGRRNRFRRTAAVVMLLLPVTAVAFPERTVAVPSESAPPLVRTLPEASRGDGPGVAAGQAAGSNHKAGPLVEPAVVSAQLSTGAADDEGRPVLLSGVAVSEFSTRPREHTFHADWSPDGKWIAYGVMHGGNYDIRCEPVAGGERVRLTTDPAWDRVPRWSPDGQKLLFASNRNGAWNLWTIEPFRLQKKPVRITSDEDDLIPPHALPANWSPDGREIVFASQRRNRELWVIPSGGGEKRRLLPDGYYGSDPDWSPDGKWIVYNSDRDGWSEIWAVPMFGGAVRRVTSLQQKSYNASWSPDGRWIAFCSKGAGSFQLWAAPFAGGTPVQLTDSDGWHTGPRWSPDGRRLVFDGSGIDIADVSGLSAIDVADLSLTGLSGVVRAGDRAAAGVDLAISAGGRLMSMTRTDSTGRYRFDLPPGSYELGCGRGAGVHPATVALADKEQKVLDLQFADFGTQFHVDDDASPGGNGTRERPFRIIQEGLNATSYGDTVRLAQGTYDHPVKPISGVTLLGAGSNKTTVTGEAHFWLAVRPLIRYHTRPGEKVALRAIALSDVVMKGFAFDGGEEYPRRTAEKVADVMAMVMAIHGEDVAAVETLLARNPGLAAARILSPDAHAGGSTFLHRAVSISEAASDEKYEIARLLIEHGADVNAEGGQARGAGESALGYAAFFGDLRLVELYLAHGADPNHAGSTGITPVDAAAREGSQAGGSSTYVPCLEALVNAGGRFHLGHLVMLEHTERLKAELDKDPAEVNEPIPLKRGVRGTPLHEAADHCIAEVTRLLLEGGADVNALDDSGRTPLQAALGQGDECCNVVELLRAAGATLSWPACRSSADYDIAGDVPIAEFAALPVREEHADWSPDGRWIAYGANHEGNRDIWIKPAAGGDPLRITSDPAHDRVPRWSPDGRKLLFASDRGGRWNLWTVAPFSGENSLIRITKDEDAVISHALPAGWSPDGSEIVFTGSRGDYELWIVSATGGDRRQLDTHGLKGWDPDWSPDGRWIAFNAHREGGYAQLWAIPAAGGEVRRLTSLAQNSYNPSWSPDGRWIAFTARDQGPFNLYAVPFAGGPLVQLTDSTAGYIGPRWSPDGGRLVFESRRGEIAIAEVGDLDRAAEREARIARMAIEKGGGTHWYVDADAQVRGDGSEERPFLTIQEALNASSKSDTIRLAPGTYSQPLDLVSGVTLLGAGADRTRITGEAHFGLALRPFIQYFERPGKEEGLSSVWLRDVVMEHFTLDGGEQYPSRPAAEVAAQLALAMAVDRNDVAEVKALLARDPGLATARILSPDAPAAGSTFLHRIVGAYGTSAEDVEMARLLIERGADVNAEGGQARGSGESALGYAGFFGSPPLVELYLLHGADPDYVSSTGNSVAGATAHEGSHVGGARYVECLEALIAAGGRFDLAHLIMLNHTERLLSELDGNPALVNEWVALGHGPDHGTPLHEAADDCNGDVAALLLDRGADIDAADESGQTPLVRSIHRGCGDEPDRDVPDSSRIIRALVEAGAEIDLNTAVILGDVEKARALLESNPGLAREPDGSGWTPLDRAVKHERAEIEQLLRALGAPFAQNVEAMLREAPPGHSVHKVLSRSAPDETALAYMHLDPSPSLDIRDEITLAAWVYLLDRGGTIIGKWYQLGSWSYVLHGAGSGFGFRLRWEDDTQDNLTDFSIPFLQWSHYAATYDGSHMRVYVNGELVQEEKVAGERIKSTNNPVWIGDSGYGNHTPGLIDDVQIWNTARTQEEIRKSMSEGLTGGEPGLVAWFPMDSKPLRDRSPHGNHGRLQGEAAIHSTGVPGDARHAPDRVLWLLPLRAGR